MKFFLDTEFIERGREFPLTLISIGIISETGDMFYRISSEFKEEDCSEWVKKNVLPFLIVGLEHRKPVAVIAAEVWAWVTETAKGSKIEFWGYYADYDWVIFAQMFGRMIDLPTEFPMYCNDLKQMAMEKGNPKLPPTGVEHNALWDAAWNRKTYQFLLGEG